MKTRPSVSTLTRAAVFAFLGLSAPGHAQPPAAPLPAPYGAHLEEIQETTVATLSGVDVGVANMWESDYVDGTGAPRKGLTARLDYEVRGETTRIVVGEGSVLPLGGVRWEVVRLVKPQGQNGTISLRPLPN